ncbi:wall-associated receptor kinase-like 20 [Typha latifolia]|uniref:wall-associated receptor kinase-like 20 n=1 Tax=Typha latifolia TaxID=4733 RepID=UPI003C2F8452
MEVPYPLSTNRECGDPNYALFCNPFKQELYLPTLNASSYLVLSIQAPSRRMVVRPPPWLRGACATQDMPKSEGLWLNQSLPFNITSSNTVFLFGCSPRLLISPLNCTATSLCHRYLDELARVDPGEEVQCASGPGPCCTFVAGGMPSAYKIRLHNSGCRTFRSVISLDPQKPPSEWQEGLEIQWNPPQEPLCTTLADCPKTSTCTSSKHCLCNSGYNWDPTAIACLRNINSKNSRPSYKMLALKLVLGVLGSFALITTIVIYIIRKNSRLSPRSKKTLKGNGVGVGGGGGRPTMTTFTWKELRKATDGFSKERILGSGGFGEVYKGVLKDGTQVAIKCAKVGNPKSTQLVLNEVGILSLVNHKNLVRLLGCCVEAPQPLLIYEYVSNGTLYEHLHMRSGDSILDWSTRLKIALQAAEALEYLHSSVHIPIYHRDVKSTNILLDEELNAKVSDFGLSRLAQPGLSHVSTCAQGTLGYLDPEYYRSYQLTEKSDVYSFGVVLLELITSKKVVDFSREADDVNLAELAKRRAKDGAAMEVVDMTLLAGDDCSSEGVLKSVELFLELAVDCLRDKKEERPSMKEVVDSLQYISGTLVVGINDLS